MTKIVINGETFKYISNSDTLFDVPITRTRRKQSSIPHVASFMIIDRFTSNAAIVKLSLFLREQIKIIDHSSRITSNIFVILILTEG